MKIFLTGASGMVGKNLLENRSFLKYDLIKPTSQELNLLNAKEVETYIEENNPDLIIHLAGKVGGIQSNINNSFNFFIENLEMGKNIILAAKKYGVKKILNFGSSCMYPKNAPNPLKEEYILTNQLEPTNEGYALAKIAILKLCEFISNENKLFHYKTIIPPNLYGRFDKFNPKNSHLLPAIINKIHKAKIENSKEVEIWGDGTARREFMYAGDLANFITIALKQFDNLPNILNVGIGYDFSVVEYYNSVANVIGYKGDFKFDLSKPVGIKQKVIDITKLKKIGWLNKISLEEGIKLTYDYFIKNISNE